MSEAGTRTYEAMARIEQESNNIFGLVDNTSQLFENITQITGRAAELTQQVSAATEEQQQACRCL